MGISMLLWNEDNSDFEGALAQGSGVGAAWFSLKLLTKTSMCVWHSYCSEMRTGSDATMNYLYLFYFYFLYTDTVLKWTSESAGVNPPNMGVLVAVHRCLHRILLAMHPSLFFFFFSVVDCFSIATSLEFATRHWVWEEHIHRSAQFSAMWTLPKKREKWSLISPYTENIVRILSRHLPNSWKCTSRQGMFSNMRQYKNVSLVMQKKITKTLLPAGDKILPWPS